VRRVQNFVSPYTAFLYDSACLYLCSREWRLYRYIGSGCFTMPINSPSGGQRQRFDLMSAATKCLASPDPHKTFGIDRRPTEYRMKMWITAIKPYQPPKQGVLCLSMQGYEEIGRLFCLFNLNHAVAAKDQVNM